MFQSIKTKLTLLVILLAAIGILTMTGISSWLVKERTEENIIESSDSILHEMRLSIEKELQQYSKGIALLTESQDFKQATADEGQAELVAALDNVLATYPNISSGYMSFVSKDTTIRPHVDLTGFDPTTREWYGNAVSAPNEVHWTKPYIDEATGEFVISASKAVQNEGKLAGVVGLDIQLATMTEEISASDIPYNGYAFLLDTEGNVIAHPTSGGENLMDQSYVAKMYEKEKDHFKFTNDGSEKVDMYTTIPDLDWKLGIIYEVSDMNALAAGLRNVMVIAAAVTLIILAAAMFIFISRMLKPIFRLQEKIQEVSNGDLTVRANIQSTDEIGALGKGFDQMLEQMNGLITTVTHSASNVLASSQNLSAVSEETNAASEEIAHALQEITRGASNSAENAENASTRADLLNQQIVEANDTAKEMDKLANEAVSVNADGRTQMGILKHSFNDWNRDLQQMSGMIGTLEDKVKAISSVIDAITNISSQTNLLALNASIEAARAGEHGKGFAVVADEVRQLAEQSARSAEQVRSTVHELQEDTQHVIQQMAGTRDTFERQSGVVQDTEGVFEKISGFIGDMQSRIKIVSDDLREMDVYKNDVADEIQNLLATTEESAAACEQVNASSDEQLHAIGTVAEAAETLTRLSEDLSMAVERFKV
ncbi:MULTISPECIES: methyl-accepting chemotaxis protein [unclassified Sporosarcina]|uniref:methyl-accepting chemotaxis protein n=1 Tax=unclassified Sporosarcina TaxID=2647733 RepID=UPI00203A6F72|nr:MULTISPECIES: methyl-accepting chemotaxis protein [unclassified Sporosarcina]GKV65845.1 methyl-accepting chemotaxis protein McpC [Sporosarcina sp. NCCP-2331]GLB55970.1 methyl-accepting chemotaxis protein McpC [Sporosarcina sp. NCCP-2378]